MEQHARQTDAEPEGPSLAGFFEGPVGDALVLARQTPGLVLVVSLQGTPTPSSLPRGLLLAAPPKHLAHEDEGEATRADEGVGVGVAEEGEAEATTTGVEASRRLDAETWSDPDVARRLSEATVALRLDWRSPDGVSFLAIYPAFQVPTIYLIAPLTGQPLGILLGFVTPQQFLAKLDECCAILARPPSSSMAAASPTSMTESATPPPPPPQELAAMDTTTAATSPREPDEGAQSANRAPPSAEAPATPQPLSAAEVAAQKERLLQRIAEAERERELARRQNGKAALETMKTIEEINKRKELEQRRREKSEAERHKAQVREKIRRDRELRAQQQQQQQAGPSIAAPLPSAATATATATTTATTTRPSAATTSATAATSAAIAFRMPDGSVEKADFAATSTLADCRKHLRTVVGVQGPFTLMTNFPRHVFADEEYALTLRDLQLCPSATLILTGATDYASSGGGAAAGVAESTSGSGTGLISSVTSYLWGFFSPSPAVPSDHQQQQQQQASAASATRPGGRAYSSGGGGAGNVHGLRRDDNMEGDEDNAYWNGNSTQQY